MAEKGAFPYLVSLDLSRVTIPDWPHEISTHACSGVIVSDRYVVTAAHCFNGVPDSPVFHRGTFSNASNWEVVTGVHSLNTSMDEGTRYDVDQITIHEGYDSYLKIDPMALNNIALMRLRSRIQYSDLVSPVCLPDPGQSFQANGACLMAGWGGGGGYMKTTQMAVGPWAANAECRAKFGVFQNVRVDAASHVCFGTGDVPVCIGDTGGPVVCKLGAKYVLAGLVSNFGYPYCGREYRVPGAFVNVANFVGWIKENMKR